MSKKNFKSNISGADKLFSVNDSPNPPEIDELISIQNTNSRLTESSPKENQAKEKNEYYRFNLKIKSELKDYVQEAAWQSKMTITEYINHLIIMDRAHQRQGS